MKHHIIAHIDAHMGCARRVVGALEEHQIAGAQVGGGYPCADAQQPRSAQPPEAPAHAAVVVDIADEAGAVERSSRRAAAPDVGVREQARLREYRRDKRDTNAPRRIF